MKSTQKIFFALPYIFTETQNFIYKNTYICIAKERRMENIVYWLINIAFAFFFTILGLFTFFLHIPKDQDFKYYRYSRYTLGIGMFALAIYCCMLPMFLNSDEFTKLSFELFISLLVSWLTYSSFLFVIYAERFRRRRFFLDGIIPISLMLALALTGLKFPYLQKVNSVLFGVIFGAKCLWMGYTCIKEYNRCTKDLENYYDNVPDLKWMYNLLWSCIVLSIATIFSFYLNGVFEHIYYILLIGIYTYLAFKVINYLPVKISRLRHDSVEMEEVKKEKKPGIDLKSKLEEPVNRWVSEMKFIEPDITIKDVAMAIGTNHNYLSKYLNSVVGMTFSVWLHTLRIEESKKLLTGPEKLSIEEIGKRVGILEIYNFSRWFKNITGLTPYQYRKTNTPGNIS